PHQTLLNCRHSLAGALGIAGSRNHRPRLGYRIDLALIVGCGTERRAIVEVGAPVPGPVPGIFFERQAQCVRPVSAPGCASGISALLCQTREVVQSGDQQPSVEDALAFSLWLHLVYPVVS